MTQALQVSVYAMLGHVDQVELPLAQAREGFERMLEGRTAGKIVFTP